MRKMKMAGKRFTKHDLVQASRFFEEDQNVLHRVLEAQLSQHPLKSKDATTDLIKAFEHCSELTENLLAAHEAQGKGNELIKNLLERAMHHNWETSYYIKMLLKSTGKWEL